MFAFLFYFMKGSAIADIIIINQLFVEWMITNDIRPKIKMGSKKSGYSNQDVTAEKIGLTG